MPGSLPSVGAGLLTWMLSSATSTAWIDQHERKGRQGEGNDRSRAVRAGSRQRCAGTKGRRAVDARSRQRTAPFAGKSLASADRPGAAARMGALRRRREPGYGWKHGEAHHGGSASAACYRNDSDASRRSEVARVQLGWLRHAVGAAGWHICFDVLDQLLGGTPIGRIAGPDAMKFGWQRLNAEYAQQFGVEPPGRPTDTPKR